MNPEKLVIKIAEIGKQNPSYPSLNEIEIFQHYYENGNLNKQKLDERDGSLTRREAITRFLLLSAVLDQGPDIVGLRRMLLETTNELYRKEIRFLHKPISFFSEIGVALDEILTQHQSIKEIRASIWAKTNQSNPNRYNLFLDNARQVLGYAIFRWGVPLILPYLLERDLNDKKSPLSASALLDYLEEHDSTEIMTQQLKDHERYGLGKAIGDKAAHLFGKWLVSSFGVSRRQDTGWDNYSYEVPYDSNAGRVLWRTGYLLCWASKDDFINRKVLQPGAGKNGTTYIRVTNIRGMKCARAVDNHLWDAYLQICSKHLKTCKKPKFIQIQQIQHIYLWLNRDKGVHVANFDDGLIYIGTQFCFNHSQPDCKNCPIRDCCEGYNSNKNLIDDFRT